MFKNLIGGEWVESEGGARHGVQLEDAGQELARRVHAELAPLLRDLLHRHAHPGVARGAGERAEEGRLEEVVGVLVVLLGEGIARAPDHDQAEAQEGHRHGHERQVGAELLGHRPQGSVRVVSRRRTSALNCRPRSA